MRIIISCFCLIICMHPLNAQKREFYQLTVYHYQSPSQEQMLDNYLQNALLPAVHKKGIKQAGVFKPIANDTAKIKRIFLLLPMSSITQVKELPEQLLKDKQYTEAGKEYLQATHTNPPYDRMEIAVLYAFELAPRLQVPGLSSPKPERVYEFRSYESATEARYRNKVKMFNQGGEIALFKRLQFNAVFYAEVLSGSRTPNLIYMTSFENMDERNKHWKAFGDDPEWKKLSAMEEYKNNVSKIDIVLMRGVDYSDL